MNLCAKMTMLFAAMLLSTAPMLSFGAAVNNEPQMGGWGDGTAIVWLCSPNMEGNVQIEIHSPEGKVYRGTLGCGYPI